MLWHPCRVSGDGQDSTAALRAYRRKSLIMGQTSPPGLGQEVIRHVIGSTVADVGCGSGVTGYLLRTAWQFTASWEAAGCSAPDRLIGVDWSPGTLAALARCNPYDETFLAGAAGLPLVNAAVDTAISMETLEHLLPSEVGEAIAELARVSRQRIIISTPAPWFVKNEIFLQQELWDARADTVPMPYSEYINLIGNLHKS